MKRDGGRQFVARARSLPTHTTRAPLTRQSRTVDATQLNTPTPPLTDEAGGHIEQRHDHTAWREKNPKKGTTERRLRPNTANKHARTPAGMMGVISTKGPSNVASGGPRPPPSGPTEHRRLRPNTANGRASTPVGVKGVISTKPGDQSPPRVGERSIDGFAPTRPTGTQAHP